jgi:HAD superfamily hydrolase (TIGR01509 family)
MTSKIHSPGIAAVVFDMDGTLLDTEPLYREAIFQASAEYGYEMTRELHMAQVGVPNDVAREQFFAVFGSEFPFEPYHKRMHQLMAEIEETRGIRLKKGARQLLELLKKRGIPAAVVTSTARLAAFRRLERTQIVDLLTVVVTRTDTEKGKPHPEPFLTAAAQLGIAPETCLALEDSPNGVRAAHAAGMKTVMVPDLVAPTEEIAALCFAVIDDLDAVAPMFLAEMTV